MKNNYFSDFFGRFSIRFKINIAVIAVSLIIILLIIIPLTRVLKNQMTLSAHEQGVTVAKTIEPLLAVYFYLDLYDEMAAVADKAMVNKDVVGLKMIVDDKVIFNKTANEMPDHFSVFYPLEDPLFIQHGSGSIEVLYSQTRLNKRMDELWNAVSIAIILVLMFIYLFNYTLGYLLQPLSQIAQLLKQYTLEQKPDFSSVRHEVETSVVVDRLNAMTDKIIEHNRYIHQENERLEAKVKESVNKIREQEAVIFQQNKLASMGEMIGNIAHQWRQPLNALALIVQDLDDAYECNEIDRNYIDNNIQKSMKQINYMSKTINDFRNFVQPAKDNALFDINKALHDSIEIVEATLHNNRIAVAFKPHGESKVIGNMNDFNQAMINLLNNAKDAIIEKRENSGIMNDDQIRIETSHEAQNIHITVTDTGGGIPDYVISRIFEPYFTTKEEGKGTGIGLYMTNLIITDKLHGSIEVDNTREGARFRITLPVPK